MNTATSQSKNRIRLDASWKHELVSAFAEPSMTKLRAHLQAAYAQGTTIYPKTNEYFAALDATPFEAVKVVILGQDPYHGSGQAHGLAFSVPSDQALPPSLRNIYKEIQNDLGVPMPTDGCLMGWAKQGVLLLNSVLTVEANQAASHQGIGWEVFTDHIIQRLSAKRSNLVFMLWGAYAQRKGHVIEEQKHCVLKSPHPSPLSAHRGFLGCRHFSKANAYLASNGETPILWGRL